MDCAVTEWCRAANFKTEFTVSVEFWAADKFHFTRAADTVKFCHFSISVKALEGRPVNSKKPFKGSSSRSNVRVKVEG